MNSEIQYQIFTLELKGYQGIEISKKLNISSSTVSRALKKISKSREYELGVISANTFLEIFKKAEQSWSQSNMQLNELIDEVKKIKVDEDRHGKSDEFILKSEYQKKMERIELLSRLIEKQDKNLERILLLAKQGELVLAVKTLREVLRQNAPSDDAKQYLKIIPNDTHAESKALGLVETLRG